MRQAIAHLATPDGPTRVLVAVAYLHVVDPPATTTNVNDLLPMLGRRRVERNLHTLAAAGLLEILPGRPRTIVPLARMVPWSDPAYPPMGGIVAGPVLRRRHQRVVGCRHRLTSRYGRLCLDCGETVANGIPTGLSSTSV